MDQCKSCLTQAESENSICPVCGIVQSKPKQELSPDEKKVRFHARAIRIVAMLHLIGAATVALVYFYALIPLTATIALVSINFILAIGLSRFSFWAYRGATIYYFLLGIVNLVSVQLPALLIVLILLYCIGNGTAKSIFERRTEIVSL